MPGPYVASTAAFGLDGCAKGVASGRYSGGPWPLRSSHRLSKALNLIHDLWRHLRDVATADCDHQVTGTSDPGDRRRRLIPDRLIGHVCRARRDRMGHHRTVDSGNGILSVATDIHHDRLVGLLQSMCELTPEVSSARVEVRLNADHDAAGTDAGASSDQGVQHLGGVMSVVVIDPDVVGSTNQLEPPVRALIPGQLAPYLSVLDAQPAGHRVRRRGIQDVVMTRHRQLNRAGMTVPGELKG